MQVVLKPYISFLHVFWSFLTLTLISLSLSASSEYSAITMTVIDIVEKSWAPALSAWQHHQSKPQVHSQGATELEATMNSVGEAVADKYDVLVDILGKPFADGDGNAQHPGSV